MTSAKVEWKQRLTFTARAGSGFETTLGTDPSVGGDDDGMRPIEMFAVGLAGCTAMDVISILQKKRQDITAFDVQVAADQAAEHPKVFTRAVIEYHVAGHEVAEDAVVRAIELSVTRYCPAHAMLSQIMPIELKYHIFEDQGSGQRKLVKSGEYRRKPG